MAAAVRRNRIQVIVILVVVLYQAHTYNHQIPSSPCSVSVHSDNSTELDFQLAKQESLDFFDDIPSHHWKLLKQKVEAMSPNFDTWYLPHPGQAVKWDKRNLVPGYFYQKSYEPVRISFYDKYRREVERTIHF